MLCLPHWDGVKIKLLNDYKNLSHSTQGKAKSAQSRGAGLIAQAGRTG